MTVSRLIAIVAAGVLSGLVTASAQDLQSLADVARQARQQKQQSTQAQPNSAIPPTPDAASGDSAAKSAEPAKTSRVYTNDDMPEHSSPDVGPVSKKSDVQENYKGGKQSAEQWKSQILQQKRSVAQLQKNIDTLNNSIRFAGGNYDYHVAYNNRQRAKQQEVETLQSQLAEQQKQLEEMQEAARHQGYSSVVYDP